MGKKSSFRLILAPPALLLSLPVFPSVVQQAQPRGAPREGCAQGSVRNGNPGSGGFAAQCPCRVRGDRTDCPLGVAAGTRLEGHSGSGGTGWALRHRPRLGGHSDTGGTGHGLGVTVALVAPVALAGRSLVTGVCLSGLSMPWSGSSPWDWPPKDVCLDPLLWPNHVHAVPPVRGCPWHPWGSLCPFQSAQPCPVLSHLPLLG